MTKPEVLEFDLTDAALYRGGFPHDLFTELRRRGPVHLHRSVKNDRGESGEFWVLVTHPVVQQANRDWETFSAIAGPTIVPLAPEQQGHTLVSADPPSHTRLRRLISVGFTPRMIAKLDDRIVHYTKVILDDVAARHGEIDFVQDVAHRLPMEMIAEIMGIPDGDRPEVFRLIDVMFRASDPFNELTPEDSRDATIGLYQYAQALGEEKRKHPTDDVWSTLATAQLEHDDGDTGALSITELDMFFIILSSAGSETTRNALAVGIAALSGHADQYRKLSEPDAVESATDEIIRWASPVTFFARQVTRDVELAGVLLHKNERITMWYPSANRDDDVFAQPFRFDIERRPNPHVSFGGGGAHYCLGAHLAKREIHTMIGEIAHRFSNVEMTGPMTYSTPQETIALSAEHLPMRFTPR